MSVIINNEELSWAANTDPTVYRMLEACYSLEQIISNLVKQKQEMFETIRNLDSLCPKKYKLPDGTIMVWHCPNHLIPETDTSQIQIPQEATK